MKRFVVMLFFIGFPFILKAQFGLEGEVRPRFEYRDGYKAMPLEGSMPAMFVNQRTRLTLNYGTEKLFTKISVQDVRIWGNEEQKKHVPGLAIHEAWAELLFNNNVSLRAGRQELVYDNQRFLANNNWNSQAQKHDAALLKLKHNSLRGHLGVAFNQQSELLSGTNYELNNYKYLNFLWLSNEFSEDFSLTALLMAEGFQRPETQNTLYIRGTYVLNALFKKDKVKIYASSAFQNGRTKTGQEIMAWYAALDFQYKIIPKLSLVLGAEVFSGNDALDTENEKYNAFNAYFGSGHSFNGHMDYFTDIPAHTKKAGLMNPYLKFAYKANDKTNLNLDFHYFALQNNYVDQSIAIDKNLGIETDIYLQRKIHPMAQIQLGYSFMLGTESMEVIRGGDHEQWAHWAYIMLTVKPKIL